MPPEAAEYYFERLETTVLPNVRRLQDAFRAKGLPEARRGHMKLAPGNIGFRVARTVE